jgi:N-methylhydantoinase B
MPISRTLAEEGVVIPPTRLVANGAVNEDVLNEILAATRNPNDGRGDFAAQISANRSGVRRLRELINTVGEETFVAALRELNDYGERLARSALESIPDGTFHFTDVMDDDGIGNEDLTIHVTLTINRGTVSADFTGTAAQVAGNINCPLSVAAAGVFYVFRCLMPEQTPACAGSFRPITISAPEGCLLNARRPAAVAAGNVETSTRVVDVVMGALAQAIAERIPAASHGSMNNLAMGGERDSQAWDYYETMGGGMGAGRDGGGLHAIQTHMTNTLNTPIEVLENRYPIRVRRYGLRDGSGGPGSRRGGDGLVREFEFLAPTTVTLLTERRRHAPWGLMGGEAGLPGENRFNDQPVKPKTTFNAQPGDRLSIATPGGGGWGKTSNE